MATCICGRPVELTNGDWEHVGCEADWYCGLCGVPLEHVVVGQEPHAYTTACCPEHGDLRASTCQGDKNFCPQCGVEVTAEHHEGKRDVKGWRCPEHGEAGWENKHIADLGAVASVVDAEVQLRRLAREAREGRTYFGPAHERADEVLRAALRALDTGQLADLWEACDKAAGRFCYE